MRQTTRLVLTSPPKRPPANIMDLFRSGEPGLIALPFFMRSMFQDAAMTIPAVVGMPVVKMLDLSGRGNHITFTNVTLQQDAAGLEYLAFNGTTSSGVTGDIDFTATDKMTVCAGVHKASDGASGMICELSASADSNAGAFYVAHSAGEAANYAVSNGTDGARSYCFATTFAAPISNVITTAINRAGSTGPTEIQVWVNGAVPSLAYTEDGLASGNFGDYPLYIGQRGGISTPLNGRLYGLIVRGAASTAGQIADAERYMAKLTGVNF
jgi:hypothetical protein